MIMSHNFNLYITDQEGDWLKTGISLREIGDLLERYLILYEKGEDFQKFLKSRGFLLDEEVWELKERPTKYNIWLDTELDLVKFKDEIPDKDRDYEEDELMEGINFNSISKLIDYCKNRGH